MALAPRGRGVELVFVALASSSFAASSLRFQSRPAVLPRHRCSLAAHVDAELLQLGVGTAASTASASVAPLGGCGGPGGRHGGDAAPQRRGVDFLSLVGLGRAARSSPVRAVWIKGYPRSGTSTTLSMVASSASDRLGDYTHPLVSLLDLDFNGTAGGSDDTLPSAASRTFALFEPCHDGDRYEPWLEEGGCGALLSGLARCNFSGVHNLWGWDNPHTTNTDDRTFSQKKATQLCSESDLVAFKTVDDRRPISEWVWLLDQQPHLRILDMVRDPRGIWASWRTTPAFAENIASGSLGTLADICELFAKNLEFHDDRVHRVVFEELVNDPSRVVRSVFSFLGLPRGEDQNAWIRRTFNAKACPPHLPWFENFTDCHEDSSVAKERWREVLTKREKELFSTTPSCKEVAGAYGYPLT